MLRKSNQTVQDFSEAYKLYWETLKMTYLSGETTYMDYIDDLVLYKTVILPKLIHRSKVIAIRIPFIIVSSC